MRSKNRASANGGRFGSDGKGISLNECITVLNRASSIVALAALAGVFASFPLLRPALADGEWEPETVYLDVVSSCGENTNPTPIPNPYRPEVNEDEVEILARLLWSSPLTNETDKRKLCWLVFNRVDDESLLFGGCVSDVVIKREFTFMDHKAYLSETNLRIARDELARWTAERMGIPVERPLEAGYLYLRFDGHSVEFLKTR